MTLISRILGFLRDMVAATLFGASSGYDAFLVAFKIPNFMRALFAEGAFSQAFVPMLADYQTNAEATQLKTFVDNIASMLFVGVMLTTLLGMLAAPWVISVFSPGFSDDVERYELAVGMLQITFPYILLISLTALAGGILNTHNWFGPPAFTPVLLNVSIILAAIFLADHLATPVAALAWGVLLGGIVQLGFQFPFLLRLQLLPSLKVRFFQPEVKTFLKRMVPALFGVSVVQINLLVGTVFASFLPVGSISWLYVADRLMQFPLGVFGVALATVVLPHLSRRYAELSEQEFSAILDWAIRSAWLIGLPALLGLYWLAGPLVTTLFQYRAFTLHDVFQTMPALQAYAFGILAFILIKVLTASFYARQDLRTPVKAAFLALWANIILCFFLMSEYQHVGLALATALAAFVNVGYLLVELLRRRILVLQWDWLVFAFRIILAATVMSIFLWVVTVDWLYFVDYSVLGRLGALATIILVAMLIYFGCLWGSGLRPAHLQLPKSQ